LQIELGGYRVVPYKSGECWQVEKWDEGGQVIATGRYKGQKLQPGWKKVEFYPATLERALRYIAEHVLRSEPRLSKGLAELADQLEKVHNDLRESLRAATCDSCDKASRSLLTREPNTSGYHVHLEVD